MGQGITVVAVGSVWVMFIVLVVAVFLLHRTRRTGGGG